MYRTGDNFITGRNSVSNSAIWRRLDNRKLREHLVLKYFKPLGLNMPKFVGELQPKVPFTLMHEAGLDMQTRTSRVINAVRPLTRNLQLVFPSQTLPQLANEKQA